MPQGHCDSTDTLRRIISLEKRQGYADDAVMGGLEAFVATHAADLATFVSGYRNAEHFARVRIVERLEDALGGARPHGREDERPPASETSRDPAELRAPVSDARGVGIHRQKALHRLGIETIEDLLTYLPRRLEDRTEFKRVGELAPGDQTCVRGEIEAVSRFRVHHRMDAVKVALGDGSGHLYCVWFNQPWMAKQLKRGACVVVFGKVERSFGELQMRSPVWEPDGEGIETGRWVPIYPATENAGDRFLRVTIRRNLARYAPCIRDLLPEATIREHGLLRRRQAITTLHVPQGPAAFETARRALAFEELFLLQLGLRATVTPKRGQSHAGEGKWATSFLAALPFRLTAGQRTALAEIVEDLASSRRMLRLLQGDVGAGKTVVALAAALHAIEAGFQAALMVPTEILAWQHAERCRRLLNGLPVSVGLLTGAATATQEVRDAVSDGAVDLIIGTHALIQESVSFHRLGLVIIDEQHRFGVVQRARIEEKGDDIDLLVMSATPIPRTLALTLYGEFDTSVIRELPADRSAVRTTWVAPSRRDDVYERVQSSLESGGQGYVIVPLVDESEKVELAAATQVAEELRHRFPKHPVGLVHGRLPATERAEVMEQFRGGAIRLLVATTVIEVGIDVANANLMVIESAERFGLSQLHQLRGRIGRAGQSAQCYAIADAVTEDARRRLEAFVATEDGFALAEEDLRIRGPGDLLGTRQHGFLASLQAVRLLEDLDLMEASRRAAREELPAAPDPDLLAEVERRFGEMLRWLEV